jgi:hypothetical protein
MLRWLIAILFLADMLAFVFVQGVFGPLPSSGEREPNRLNRQVHPEWLKARPISAAEVADQAVVGAPAPQAPVQASALTQ